MLPDCEKFLFSNFTALSLWAVTFFFFLFISLFVLFHPFFLKEFSFFAAFWGCFGDYFVFSLSVAYVCYLIQLMFGHHFDNYFHVLMVSFVVFISPFINITWFSSTVVGKTYLSSHINLNGAVGTAPPQFILESLCLRTLFIVSLSVWGGKKKELICSLFFSSIYRLQYQYLTTESSVKLLDNYKVYSSLPVISLSI